jgi:hypothetical protein
MKILYVIEVSFQKGAENEESLIHGDRTMGYPSEKE